MISTPEHTTPRRARAYRLDDGTVAAIAARHAPHRPELDELSQGAADVNTADQEDSGGVASPDDAAASLWAALRDAPKDGRSVKDLMAATGMGRSWVYARLQELAAAGTVAQVARGRWVLGPRPNAPVGHLARNWHEKVSPGFTGADLP